MQNTLEEWEAAVGWEWRAELKTGKIHRHFKGRFEKI